MSRQFNRPVEFDPSLISRSHTQSTGYVSQHQYLSREQVLKNEFGLDNEEEEKVSNNQSINRSNNQFDGTGDYSDLGFGGSDELSINQSVNRDDEEIERLTEQCSLYQRTAFVAESNVARLEASIESINQTNKQTRTMLIKQFKDQINQLLAEIDEQKQMLNDDDETISQLRSAIARFDSGDEQSGQSILQTIDQSKVAEETRAQQREILELKAQIKRLELTTKQSTNSSQTSSPDQSNNQSKVVEPPSIATQSSKQPNKSAQAEQISKLESINQTISKSLEKCQHDLQAANQTIKQLNQSINQLKKDLATKDQSIAHLNQSIKQLEQSNKQLEISNQVSSLSINQLTEQSNRQSVDLSSSQYASQAVNQLKQTVNQLTVENNQLKSNLDSRTKEVEICKQSITQLQQTISQASSQSNNQTAAQTQELTQKLMNEQLINQSMKQLNDESSLKIQSLNETISQLQQSIKQSDNQSESFTQRERQLENQISAYKLQIESINQSINQSNQSVEQYQAEVQSIKDKAKEKLAQASQSIKQLKTEYASLRSTYQSQKLAHQQAINQLSNKSNTQCIKLSSNVQSIKQSNNELRTLVETMNETFIASLQPFMMRKLGAFHENLASAYRKEVILRKSLFNQLQEMKGNIRVYCRVRPQPTRANVSAAYQAANGSAIAFKASPDSSICSELTITNPEKKTSFMFEFDGVFQPASTQSEVFEEVSGLVTSVMDGFNVCMFAYGQTGSGKSHTMQGSADNPGVNIRALERLFSIVDERSSEWDWSIKISLIEIYNEKVQDLLNPAGVTVCKANHTANGLVIQDLTYVDVASSSKVLDVLAAGSKNRKVSATAMNADSSRSHLILSVYVTGQSKFGGKSTIGKLHLIDLAGSERIARSGVTGDGLKEAQAINLSLSALGNVISARANKAAHVPYRDSTLTYLLQDSLEKNSKTLMFVQVSPDPSDAAESICSLRFAERVRKVELGKATATVVNAKK